jgi:hypothetical protein
LEIEVVDVCEEFALAFERTDASRGGGVLLAGLSLASSLILGWLQRPEKTLEAPVFLNFPMSRRQELISPEGTTRPWLSRLL